MKSERTHRLAGALRNLVSLGLGNYGAMALGLAINSILARQLGTEQYGRLALMLMVSQILVFAAVNWTHTGFVRFGSLEFAAKGSVSETFWARLGMVLPITALGVVVIVLARRPLAAYLDIPQIAIWIILAHFASLCALSVTGAILQASEQMTRYGICLFLDKAVTLFCVILLSSVRTVSPLAIVSCYAASSMSVAVWGASVVGGRAFRPGIPSRDAYRDMVWFSVPLLLSSWAGFFGTNWFDLVILRKYVPISGIGVYSLATQLAGVVQQITIIFSTLVLPHLSLIVAEGGGVRISTFVERLLPYWLLGTSILFSLAVVGARAGIPLVFGRSFDATAAVLVVLMVASCAMALFNAIAPLISAYGATWFLTAISVASVIVNILLDFALIPRFGITGSAMATVLAYGTSATLALMLVRRKTGGKVIRLAWLSAPVLVACACFMLLDGAWFYIAAPVGAVVTVLVLVAAFGLFRTRDAIFLEQLQLSVPFRIGVGVWR